jgi:hypothetical protein
MIEPGRDVREAESERIGPGPPIAPGGVRRLLRLATIDIGPLRHRRDFRLLWIGQGVSFFGSMITYVAIPFQAYQLSGSSLVVGLLGLAELAPLLAAAFIGGALADACRPCSRRWTVCSGRRSTRSPRGWSSATSSSPPARSRRFG